MCVAKALLTASLPTPLSAGEGGVLSSRGFGVCCYYVSYVNDREKTDNYWSRLFFLSSAGVK